MKVRYLLYILLLLFLACEFQTEDNSEENKTDDEASSCSVALSLPWTGDYSIDTAAYTVRNVETGEEFTGAMTCDSANQTATATLELTEGYWEAEARVEHLYSDTTGTAFAFDTGISSTYISGNEKDYTFVMSNPFSQDVNGLEINANINEMTAEGYTPDSVGVWLYNPDSGENYFFQLRDGTGDYRYGSYPFIKRGKYAIWLVSENTEHPDWTANPWQLGISTATPFRMIELNDSDGSSHYRDFTLQGHFYLNSSTMGGWDTNYEDDLFFSHTENSSGFTFYDSAPPYVQMWASTAGDPATFSLDPYPVGENKITRFSLYFMAPSAGPLVTLHMKKDIQDFDTRITIEIYQSETRVKTFLDGVQMTDEGDPYGFAPGSTTKLAFFMREDKLGLYIFDLVGNVIHTYSWSIDSSIPNDLFLHFETTQPDTTDLELHDIQIINNFKPSPPLTYP